MNHCSKNYLAQLEMTLSIFLLSCVLNWPKKIRVKSAKGSDVDLLTSMTIRLHKKATYSKNVDRNIIYFIIIAE
jgi:hypothetical protein